MQLHRDWAPKGWDTGWAAGEWHAMRLDDTGDLISAATPEELDAKLRALTTPEPGLLLRHPFLRRQNKAAFAFHRFDQPSFAQLLDGPAYRLARCPELGGEIKLRGQAGFRGIGAVLDPRRDHVGDLHVNQPTAARREPGAFVLRHEVTIDTALPQPTLR